MSTPLRYAAIFLASAGLVVGLWFVMERGKSPTPGEPPKPPGRLVVLIVFDQMRGDYPDRWSKHFGENGFERIKKGGVWYSDVHIPYACTSTGPGHASIITGAPPSVHGIVENDWYDRTAGARVYCAQPLRPFDRVPPAPKGVPGRGSDIGMSPERLLVETVGDKLQASSAKSRVVSLSIKDRTAVLLGGKKPDAAYCFDSRDGQFHTGAYYRQAVHPWVEEFNKSGRVDAWIGKEWTRFKPIDYEFMGVGSDDAAGEATGVDDGESFSQKRTFPHPFPSKAQKDERPKLYYASVEMSPAGNELLIELAKKAIAAENLGNGEAADLLCLSFSSNDLIGHSWGPDSHEMLDITLRSDAMLADFLAHLDEKLADRWAVVVTSDHGVCPIPEQKLVPGAVRKSVRDVLPQLAAALDDAYGIPPGGPTNWFELETKDNSDLWPWLYLNHKAIAARKLDPAAVADFAAQFIGNRGFMQTAFTRKQIESGTLPPGGNQAETKAMLERVKLAYRPDRCGDVIGIPKPGVLVTGYGTGTSHGSPQGYDTHIPVMAFGAGVPGLGKRTEPRSSLTVAPTLAAILGLEPPAAAMEKSAFDPVTR
ncbi:MAG: alkaline phosphatase family protein [Gemmataceae bacterium]